MKKLVALVACVFALSLTACDKKPAEIIGCAAQNVVKTSVAAVVAQELSCKNIAAIEASLETELNKTKICKKDEATTEGVVATDATAKSAFGDLVCTPVINSVMALATAQVPTEWGCDPSAKVDTLKEKLVAKCKETL